MPALNDPAEIRVPSPGAADRSSAAAMLADAIADFQAGRLAQARKTCDAILAQLPDEIGVLHFSSVIAAALGNLDDAIAAARRVLERQPDHAEAQHNLGALLARQCRFPEALSWLERAAAQATAAPLVIHNLALVLRELGRHEDAVLALDRLLQRCPDDAEALHQKAAALVSMGQAPAAVTCLTRSAEINPRAATYSELSGALRLAGQLGAAIAASRRALALEPTNEAAAVRLLFQLEQACEWADIPRWRAQVSRQTATALSLGRCPHVQPFAVIGYDDDPRSNLHVAAAHARAAERRAGKPLGVIRRIDDRGPLTIGYLSRDFREHATAHLIARCFEQHDRQMIRVHAYAYGPDVAGEMRQRLRRATDMFVDIDTLDHRRAAERIAADKVDILIDLMGHTSWARMEIPALRPAPIQAAWLGFPGSTGSRFHDYALVDRIVAPPADARFFSERLIWLPDSYQPNDDERAIATEPADRAAIGLPDDTLVLCSFNQGFKIEPVMFGLWMDLLKAVPRARLLLWALNDTVEDNLRREAGAQGVDRARLHFGDRLPKEQHLRRLQLADLALDTLIYNGHTTTSDALWAGLPVLALEGRHFASRVSASLLRAVGLPELVARSLGEYRDLALTLMQDPARLAALRAKLAVNRAYAPLFRSRRFARGLEAAYRAMAERQAQGLAPAAMAIEIDDRGALQCRAADDGRPARPGEALDRMAEGTEFLKACLYERAIARFHEALVHDSSFTEARLQLGAAQAAKGDRAAALATLQAAHAECPGHPLAGVRLAALLRELGHFDEALSLLDQAIDRDPSDAEALAERSRRSREKERRRGAVSPAGSVDR
jgi:protein O-GlcNAc transferase